MTVIVQESELQARLPELIELVRMGEQVLIEDHGEVVACLVQPSDKRVTPDIIDSTRKSGRTAQKLTLDEILSWRHEDHAV